MGIHASTVSRSCLTGQHQRDDDLYYIRDMDTLGKRLIWAREQKGLTQEGLAKLGGVSQGTIGNLEAGIRQTARRIVDIAAALDVDPNWLANGRGSPESKLDAEEARVPVNESAAPDSLDDMLNTLVEMVETYRLASPDDRERIDFAFREARNNLQTADKLKMEARGR